MIDNEITLGFSGASGAIYGWRLLECLAKAQIKTHIIMTPAGALVFKDEIDENFPGNPKRFKDYVCEKLDICPSLVEVHGKDNWYAPQASGRGAPSRMVVCPCSTGCLSAIATGASDNLLERAADVIIKERGNLILLVREMPLSAIHLQHMLTLSQLGVCIMPASPGFYQKIERVEDLVDFVVSRILDQLKVENDLIPKWGR